MRYTQIQDLQEDLDLDLAELYVEPDQDLVEMRQKNNFFHSKRYLSASAKDKFNALWREISSDQKPGSFPSRAGLAQIFAMDMNASFDHPGDTLKGLMLRDRPKFIHSVGVTGHVQFVPSRNAKHFSGLFSHGADYGIIRFSSAAKPVEASQPLAPGFGLKFLRNGIDSANLVAMLGVDGQPGEWDFFANDFTNHIAPAKS